MENILATLIFIILMAGVIALVVYKMKHNDPNMSIETFIETYYDNLIDVLKDSVKLLSVDVSDYQDRESYLKAIISLAIQELDNNCEGFGIDTTIFELFDHEVLTKFLYDILHRNNIFIFEENVPIGAINTNPELFTYVEVNAIVSYNNGDN
jgi:hypothetical protein